MTGFLFVAVAMTLVAVTLVVTPLLRDRTQWSAIAGVVAAVAIPVSVILLYATYGSFPGQLQEMAGASTTDTREIADLKQALERQGDDAAGWMRLGDAYLAAERFADAREAYRAAIGHDKRGDDEIRLAFAEASILADRNSITGEAGQVIDEVLARNPANPKALWYGGMAALASGNPLVARERWGKLLELGPPPQVRDVITQQLAALDAAAGTGAAPAPAAARAARIAVRVNVSPGLAARIREGAALFLIARAPGAAGPPLAVVRRDSPRLPLDLEISDADSMVPGRSMAGLAEVRITARVANDGEALPAPGDVFGEATWNPGATAAGPLEITMDRVVE